MKKSIVCLLFFCLQSEALLFNSVEKSLLRFKRGIIRNKLEDIHDKKEEKKDQLAEEAVNKLMNTFLGGGAKPTDEELEKAVEKDGNFKTEKEKTKEKVRLLKKIRAGLGKIKDKRDERKDAQEDLKDQDAAKKVDALMAKLLGGGGGEGGADVTEEEVTEEVVEEKQDKMLKTKLKNFKNKIKEKKKKKVEAKGKTEGKAEGKAEGKTGKKGKAAKGTTTEKEEEEEEE